MRKRFLFLIFVVIASCVPSLSRNPFEVYELVKIFLPPIVNSTSTGTATGTSTGTSTGTATGTSTGTSTGTATGTTTSSAPSLSYSGSPFTFQISVAITAIAPIISGGTPTSCSSNPTLPSGLSINSTTCAISGTPTSLSTATNYAITATNSVGSSTSTINITVGEGAPTISASTITVTSITTTSLTLNWTLATDDVTPQASLQYKIVKSTTAPYTTVTAADAVVSLPDLVQDWTTNISTLPVAGLTTATPYYFSIIVKDSAGNMSLYTPKITQTSTGQISGLTLSGSTIFATDVGYNKLYKMDLDGIINGTTSFPNLPTEMAIVGNYMYIAAAGANEMYTVDLTTSPPTHIVTLPLAFNNSNVITTNGTDVSIQSADFGGSIIEMIKLDLTTPSSPTLSATKNTRTATTQDHSKARMNASYLFTVSAGMYTFLAIDATTYGLSVNKNYSTWGRPMNIAINSTEAYVLSGPGGGAFDIMLGFVDLTSLPGSLPNPVTVAFGGS